MNIATTRGQTKSMSLPNILTYARIAAIPVVVGCIYWQSIMDGPLWLRWVALAVFLAAAVTDYLDGYYARIWDQQSAFGRMLDPIADKLLVASCLLMLAADGSINRWTLWAAFVILCREILVSGLREYLAKNLGHEIIKVKSFNKLTGASVVSANTRRIESQNPTYVAGHERGVLPIGV